MIDGVESWFVLCKKKQCGHKGVVSEEEHHAIKKWNMDNDSPIRAMIIKKKAR